MENAATPDPDLAELKTLGLRLTRVIVDAGETEQRILAAAACWLPDKDTKPASLEEATSIGLIVDGANELIAKVNPRLATLTQCYERLARAIRRTAALSQRIQHGWPQPRALSDDRRAMRLRQAVRATREMIRTRTEGDAEAAERYFDDLSARLDDPDFEHDLRDLTVKEMVQALSRAIGLLPEDTPPPDTAAIAGFGEGPSPNLGRDRKP